MTAALRRSRLALAVTALAATCVACDSDEGSGTTLTLEETPPLEESEPLDPARVRYGEVQVESMNAENRVRILVTAANVDGVGRSELAPERLVVRIAYDTSRTSPQQVADAISGAGFPAGVLRHSMPLPDDFPLQPH